VLRMRSLTAQPVSTGNKARGVLGHRFASWRWQTTAAVDPAKEIFLGEFAFGMKPNVCRNPTRSPTRILTEPSDSLRRKTSPLKRQLLLQR
jgi:hypothetical protein